MQKDLSSLKIKYIVGKGCLEENTCMGIPRRGLAAGAAGPPGRGRAHAGGRSFGEKGPRGCSGGQKIRMCSVLREKIPVWG